MIAVVAIAIAIPTNSLRNRRQAMSEIRAIGASYSFKHWDDATSTIPSGTNLDELAPPGPRWLPLAVRIYLLSDVSRIHLQSWPDMTSITDEQLSKINLACLKPEDVELVDLPITDVALDRIVEIDGLEDLVISGSKITDVGVAKIAKLPHLKRLWLPGALITDGCLVHLKTMKSLENLVLPNSVSDRGVEELKRSLPGLTNFHR